MPTATTASTKDEREKWYQAAAILRPRGSGPGTVLPGQCGLQGYLVAHFDPSASFERAVDGSLPMPIGKSVGNALSMARLEEVVNVSNCIATIEKNPPAPNAFVIGGYNQILRKISEVVDKYI